MPSLVVIILTLRKKLNSWKRKPESKLSWARMTIINQALPSKTISPPAILAPAGNKASFLAALAAGADAVYCGLKSFSARMEAKNFTINELIPLTHLAHEKNIKVYVALNTLLKAG